MIAYQALAVRYPGAVADAVDGVTFTAEPGRLTAVVGPNGSGKSSLVRALLRRVRPARGAVCVDDRPVTAWAPRALARRVAVVVQREEPTFPLAVAEYVALGRDPHRAAFAPEAAADRAAVARALERSGVAALAARRTDTLSGGEWQRTRIARALAQDGAALVVDEPTTFLDVAHEMAVFELLAALAAEGRAILLVSHQLNLVARFADRLVLLHAGRVAADGPPAAVLRGEVLERVYGWPVVVSRDAAVGAPQVVPLRVPPRA